MIEREAAVASDRAKIAAVIYNRLAIGMPLGIDATIGYIDPDPSNGLTVVGLRDRQPVQHAAAHGLPPTPIAAPGSRRSAPRWLPPTCRTCTTCSAATTAGTGSA